MTERNSRCPIACGWSSGGIHLGELCSSRREGFEMSREL